MPVAGSCTCGTRGSCAGQGLRAGLAAGISVTASGSQSAAALASSSSRLNSSWAICASSCSEERPNFKRFSRQLQLQLLDQHIAGAQLRGEVIDFIAGRNQELLEALDIGG